MRAKSKCNFQWLKKKEKKGYIHVHPIYYFSPKMVFTVADKEAKI